MQKVSIQQVKAGMGYLGESLVRVCRGIIKEAKAQLVLTISVDYILKDVEGQQEVSVCQQQKKGKGKCGLIGKGT